MIQTHFVRLEPPYQVIFCNGQLGLQIGSLIAVEEKRDEKGKYGLVTHTHPVVNYGSKDTLKFFSGGRSNVWTSPGDYAQGAVWDKAEVSDVLVIGLMSEEGYTTMNEEGFAELVARTLEYRIQQQQTLQNTIYYLNRNLRLLGMAPHYDTPSEVQLHMACIDYDVIPFIQMTNADYTIRMAVPFDTIERMKEMVFNQLREYKGLFSKKESYTSWSFIPEKLEYAQGYEESEDNSTEDIISKQEKIMAELAKELNSVFGK